MATQNNAISVGNNILVDTNLDLYANNITYRSITYRGYVGGTAGFSFGGANSGPTIPLAPGGGQPTFTLRSEIDRFAFASESTITNAGGLSANRGSLTGHSSSTFGYSAGGITSYTTPPYSPNGTVIDRFPFSTPFVTASSVGSLSSSRATAAGISGDTNGFVAEGRVPDAAAPATIVSTIDRFPFASSPVNAVAAGTEISGVRQYVAGVSSGKDGYVLGGCYGPGPTGTITITNNIYKFPFINAVRSTQVGFLSTVATPGTFPGRFGMVGVSGITDGYTIGGQVPTPGPPGGFWPNAPIVFTNIIDRFPFANEITNAFNTGTLSGSKSFMSGLSSSTNGYSLGGATSGPSPGNSTGSFAIGPSANPGGFPGDGVGFSAQTTVLERFPFATGTVTGSSVGTLSVGKHSCASAQY